MGDGGLLLGFEQRGQLALAGVEGGDLSSDQMRQITSSRQPFGNGTLRMTYRAGFLAFATMATRGIGRAVFDWYASYRLLLVPFMSSQSRG